MKEQAYLLGKDSNALPPHRTKAHLGYSTLMLNPLACLQAQTFGVNTIEDTR